MADMCEMKDKELPGYAIKRICSKCSLEKYKVVFSDEESEYSSPNLMKTFYCEQDSQGIIFENKNSRIDFNCGINIQQKEVLTTLKGLLIKNAEIEYSIEFRYDGDGDTFNKILESIMKIDPDFVLTEDKPAEDKPHLLKISVTRGKIKEIKEQIKNIEQYYQDRIYEVRYLKYHVDSKDSSIKKEYFFDLGFPESLSLENRNGKIKRFTLSRLGIYVSYNKFTKQNSQKTNGNIELIYFDFESPFIVNGHTEYDKFIINMHIDLKAEECDFESQLKNIATSINIKKYYEGIRTLAFLDIKKARNYIIYDFFIPFFQTEKEEACKRRVAILIEEAEKNNNVKANRILGDLYYYGQGVHQDYKKAKEYYDQAARQGNADAQYMLGELYYYGDGVNQDYKKAKDCYTDAARQGNADAQYMLGELYYYGQGVHQDYKKAKEYYDQAARQGNADAQCSLGELYYYGDGVNQDYIMARDYYIDAAQKGNADAQYRCGCLYQYGKGVVRNYESARYWYEKAALQGDSDAQNDLGDIYRDGRGGITRDYDKAKSWYKKAAEQGNQSSIKSLAELSSGEELQDAVSESSPKLEESSLTCDKQLIEEDKSKDNVDYNQKQDVAIYRRDEIEEEIQSAVAEPSGVQPQRGNKNSRQVSSLSKREEAKPMTPMAEHSQSHACKEYEDAKAEPPPTLREEQQMILDVEKEALKPKQPEC